MMRRKVGKLLGDRRVVGGFLLLIQLAIVMFGVGWASTEYHWLTPALTVLSVIIVIWLVRKYDNPMYKITWMLVIVLLPLFGGLFYLFWGNTPLNRARTQHQYEPKPPDFTDYMRTPATKELIERHPRHAARARYIETLDGMPVWTNTETKYFRVGEEMFDSMCKELRRAQKFIFLEYFIIDRGVFWDSILEILEEKVRAGVDVRVIYDDVGCLYTLPKNYWRELEEKGIRCRAFNRFIPVLSVRLNNRDHRKFCIVDGHTAFTGGINLADEYINQKLRYGHWKDTAILLKGEAVWSMTVMFLTMWEYTRDVEEDYRRFRPDKLPPEAAQGAGYYVQPYADNPLDEEAVGEAVYLNLINKAERYVYAMTPYLIISDSVNTALCNAAKSGGDVRIITPHIPDKALVFELTRSHYESLLEAGVQIFEYTPGFVHAKVMVTDDCCGVVGSINLDYRSMFLHFEDAVLLYHDPTVLDIKRDFINTQFRSQPVTLEQCLGHSWIRRLFRSILRVLAPLL